MKLELLENGNFRTSEQVYSMYGIVVPAGFETDLASIPRLLWVFMPPWGKYAKAAVIHDYMYKNAIRTKKKADLVFLYVMKDLGVPKWKRRLMYRAVRLLGRGSY